VGLPFSWPGFAGTKHAILPDFESLPKLSNRLLS
jgi:hypothetical protein